MSRTKHHKMQKHQHVGHDYGSRANCNKTYNNSYGTFGRKRLHKELRAEVRLLKNEWI